MTHTRALRRLLGAAALFGTVSAAALAQSQSPSSARATIADDEIQVLGIENMSYPPGPYMKRAQGAVVVRAELDDSGRVVGATALSGPMMLVADTLANVKKWNFKPNSHKAVIVVYDFRIDGACNGLTSHSILRLPNVMSVRGCIQMVQP